jgi:hypothetical protein
LSFETNQGILHAHEKVTASLMLHKLATLGAAACQYATILKDVEEEEEMVCIGCCTGVKLHSFYWH